ncbi:MAG TPA: amidohydrolase family protein [Thermomicrobiales bacterium]|nr:amidohydrolase family protein [Thermomicrobiales bacterium]
MIDAHTHLFPEEVVRDRARFLARDPWFGETFGHPKAATALAPELIASMDGAGIARSIVCGWPWRDQALCRMHNDALAAVGKTHPDRVSWLGIVNPAHPGAAPEVVRCIELGAVGIGELNADGQGFAWERPHEVAHFAEACIALDVPVLIHTSEPVGHLYPGKGTATVARLLPFLEAFPALRVVMAHWGGGLPFFELMPEVAAAARNVVYDSAASTYLYRFDIFPAVECLVGSGRILFGSDFPVLKQAAFLRKTLGSGLSPAALGDVLHDNAVRTFRLPGFAALDTPPGGTP